MDIFSLDTDVFVLCLRIYPKNKVHNTKMQLKKQTLFCTELNSCGTEDESCIKLMLDDQSIDEDSCKSFTNDI